MTKLSKDADNWLLEMFILHGDRPFDDVTYADVMPYEVWIVVRRDYVSTTPRQVQERFYITSKGIEYIKSLSNDS